MKLRVEVDGVEYLLYSRNSNGMVDYILSGAATPLSGAASVVPLGEGAFSVLLNSAKGADAHRSFTVRTVREAEVVFAYVDGQRYEMRVSDARDRRSKDLTLAAGPVDIRSQMPGKVVRLLVAVDQEVEAGQGLVVMEAMKMQNEITAPKIGRVERITVAEGTTVSQGEVLMTIV